MKPCEASRPTNSPPKMPEIFYFSVVLKMGC
jgi:hypothetical protein